MADGVFLRAHKPFAAGGVRGYPFIYFTIGPATRKWTRFKPLKTGELTLEKSIPPRQYRPSHSRFSTTVWVSSKMSWFTYALVGMLSFACMALCLKKITYLLPTPIVLFYLFALTSLLYLFFGLKRNLEFHLSLGAFGLLILAALFAFVGNFGDVEALRLAPNPGYASAVKAGQIVLITFAALLIFPDQRLSLQGIGGVILVFLGVVLLALEQ